MANRQCKEVSVTDNSDIQALILDLCIDIIENPSRDNINTIDRLYQTIQLCHEVGNTDLHLSVTMMLEYVMLYYMKDDSLRVYRIAIDSIIYHNVVSELGKMKNTEMRTNDMPIKHSVFDNVDYALPWRNAASYRNGDIIDKFSDNEMYSRNLTTMLLGRSSMVFSPLIINKYSDVENIINDTITADKFYRGKLHYRIPEED